MLAATTTTKTAATVMSRRILSSSFVLLRQTTASTAPAATVGASAFRSAANFSSTAATNLSSQEKKVVVAGGVRLPFSMASTIYENEMAVDLQRLAITGLMNQTALPKTEVDYVLCGNVIQEVKTSNIAREAAVNAGLPYNIPAHTVAQACISSNVAITSGSDMIKTGHASVVIAGGVETFSDVPIRLTRPIRQKLITLPKAMKKGGPIGAIRHMLKGLKGKDLALETPAIANYTTGEVMGVSSDKLSAHFGVSRQQQDEFTVRSHSLAAKAHAEGWYDDEIVPYKGKTDENGIKGDSTIESVSKLKPAFVKPYGTHTAANSSFLTDGAAATLLMSEDKAKELNMKPWCTYLICLSPYHIFTGACRT
jgi:acetyl-CoA acyltransferase